MSNWHDAVCDVCAFNINCEYTARGAVEDCDIVRDYETNMSDTAADELQVISEETYLESRSRTRRIKYRAESADA